MRINRRMKSIGKGVGRFAWQTNNPWEGLQYLQKRGAPDLGGYFQDNPLSNLGFAWGEITGKNRAYDQNAQNLRFQQEKLAYDKQLQKDIFAREDNAVQRRKSDLLGAGLSPVLAAGQAAATGAVVNTAAPRGEPLEGPNLMEAVKLAASLYTMKADVARTFAQTALTNAQQKNVNIDTDNKFYDTVIKKIDAINSARSGLGKDTSMGGKLIKDVEAWLNNFRDSYQTGEGNSANKGYVPKGVQPHRDSKDFKKNWRGKEVLR